MRVLLLLCLLGAAAPAPRVRRDTAQWLTLIAEIARLGGAEGGTPLSTSVSSPASHYLSAPVLPPAVRLEGPGGTTTLQLVLVPVPAASVPAQCALNPPPAASYSPTLQSSAPLSPVPSYASSPPAESYSPTLQSSGPLSPVPSYASSPPAASSIVAPVAPVTTNNVQQRLSAPTTKYQSEQTNELDETLDDVPPIQMPSTSSAPSPLYRHARGAPYFPPTDNSAVLLQQFLAEADRDASLPPIVLDDSPAIEEPTALPAIEEPAAAPTTKSARVTRCARACKSKRRAQWSVEREPTPAVPRFERSMTINGVLTVPRARFTERYTVRWDPASGAARIDYHDGAASTYRARVRGGNMQAILLRTDRTGTAEVRRCLALGPRRARPSERAPPALPAPHDLAAFEFAGYVERAERWRRTVRGVRARGEALTYRHELLVTRAADNITAVPLRYAVAVDSTLLGDNCDRYVHLYDQVTFVQHDSATFQLNVGDACDQIEATNQTHLVEPLREFTLAQRDPRYEEAFQEYKSAFGRAYADELEEAIRKLLLISTERFVSSGNREGATFEMEVNFMGDRLIAERVILYGATEEALAPGEPFPYSKEKLEGLKGRMLRSFSWVKQGGVSHVRNQLPCESCWAFAVAGAVEGALFVRTGRLVPLSEQCLVDCGGPFHTNGCKPTWPNFAYDYVKHRGLPALEEYPSYTAKMETCRTSIAPSVTRISGHVNVTGNSLTALQVALRRHGPVVVLVNAEAESFVLHKKGIYSDRKCKRMPSTHAMLAVGWTTVRGMTYFRLKNSWGEAWGEGGYAWLRGDTNACGVLRLPSYPVLSAADVLRVPADAPAGAPAA